MRILFNLIVPESMLWLLLTGNVPTVDEVRGLSEELAAKGKLPSYAEKIIDSFPKTMREYTSLLKFPRRDECFLGQVEGRSWKQ